MVLYGCVSTCCIATFTYNNVLNLLLPCVQILTCHALHVVLTSIGFYSYCNSKQHCYCNVVIKRTVTPLMRGPRGRLQAIRGNPHGPQALNTYIKLTNCVHTTILRLPRTIYYLKETIIGTNIGKHDTDLCDIRINYGKIRKKTLNLPLSKVDLQRFLEALAYCRK